MKPASPTPHDPLDELLAAALHGELTATQRTELDALLQHDPAARAAYQETQAMHDLLERNHRDAQPDAAFEDRLISSVRQKTRDARDRETPWESALALWRAVKRPFGGRRTWKEYAAVLAIVTVLAVVAWGPIQNGVKKTRSLGQSGIADPAVVFALPRVAMNREGAGSIDSISTAAQERLRKSEELVRQSVANVHSAKGSTVLQFADERPVAKSPHGPDGLTDAQARRDTPAINARKSDSDLRLAPPQAPSTPSPTASTVDNENAALTISGPIVAYSAPASPVVAGALPAPTAGGEAGMRPNVASGDDVDMSGAAPASAPVSEVNAERARSIENANSAWDGNWETTKKTASSTPPAFTGLATQSTSPEPSRKLVRDARLDLEVKGYQPAVDAVTALAKAAGGYVDSSNSQRGGNGKLQGTVVVKILPENLDGFLLKLRDLGEIQNQSVSTEDVTKDYYDTQARLDNSRRMETQLQELLKRDNGRVSDLLQVERELGRVRGEIEQMQGQLKLYDFQVQFATVTMSVAEKDLNQAAAYLLRENDSFSLFTHDVEAAFAQAKGAADTFKAEILSANLQHDTGSNSMAASLDVSVPPDQIDGFLTRVRALGRVDNFTRTTNRVANDGGDTSQPADQTRTEKDRVQVELTIRADDESPRQVTQLAVASTGDIDTQAQQLKDDAAKSGAAVTASNFERAPDGTETATLTFRLALSKTGDLLSTLEKLGRVESLTVQRNDRPDQAAADPTAPAEIRLSLHNMPVVRFEDETPCQQTQLAIASTGDVDAQAQQVKSDALKAGMAVTASSFERQPDGTESAALTFRVPLAKAADFTATLEKLGHVESLAVQRNDVTGNSSTDPNAPAEISLSLHNEPAFVADDRGFWATLKRTFGHGIAAFLGSVEMVGVLIAFVLPWLVALIVFAWIGRRIYVARRARS
jgi:hypothetical protein